MAMAAAAAAAAGCQQHGLETRHVSSRWYVFYSFLFFYYTNVCFRSTKHVKTTMPATAAAWARDATRLEPLVHLYIYLLHSHLFKV